ncbi:MAG: M3 family oligoendopeptidase [Desulfobulbaceae bacterium]|nr:M3 family oligoendopeptidase [Desulfobulbaceae bacterium]
MSNEVNLALGTTDIVWQLTDLYQTLDDPHINADLDLCQTEAEALQAEFAGKLSALSPKSLLNLVGRLEKIGVMQGRLATFAFLNFVTQIQEAKAGAFLQKIREKSSAIAKLTVFFELEWNTLPDNFALQLLADPSVKHYHHYLASLRRYARHLLSHQEEALLIETAPVGRGAWTLLFEKVVGNIKFGDRERTEEEVLADLYHEDRAIRQAAAGELTAGLRGQLHILSHITNTLLADKMIDDRLRHYSGWLCSMNLYNEISDDIVAVLVQTVTSRYDIPARYYRLKKQLLGLDELFDYDRYAPLANLPAQQVSWDECRGMVLAAFADFSGEMAEIAELFFTNNWIHAPIMDGKRGGAFAHPCTPDVHPYVMVNFTGNIRDVSTVAHELGHGVHQYLAAEKGYFNSGTPLVLAETASVFAELILFTHQLELLSTPAERTAFTAQKLESIFATVFRQIAMNRFEELSHNARREEGELSTERLNDLWRQTQQAMFGDSVSLTEDYAVWWSYIPHFLSTPGYVYSYAFGELLVLALYNLYLQDKDSFVPKYLTLLKAGGSDCPEILLQPFAVDLNDPEFWAGGLQVIDGMLRQIE